MESVTLFFTGMKDSLRIGWALKEIGNSDLLMRRSFSCVMINGVIYLGSVLLYNAFISFLPEYISELDFFSDESSFFKQSFLVTAIKIVVGFFYLGWILLVYLVSMTLTTFWAQDIFDEARRIKMERLLKDQSDANEKLVSELKQLGKLKSNMNAKQWTFDMIQRSVTITIYLMQITLTSLFARLLLGRWISALLEVLLYSFLNAFYCFEYKTAASAISNQESIFFFEQQWEYFMGFGFPFTLLLFLFKSCGSSVYFLFFPLIVVISIDEHGQGLLIFREERVNPKSQGLFSFLFVARKLYVILLQKFAS